MHIDVLANNNGIIDNDAEGDQKRKQRCEIECLAREVHHDTRSQQRDGNPHRHPERQPHFQKQRQQNEHEQ